MDRSLWLLIRLRNGGVVRRWLRSLRTPKGALLAVVGSLVFMPLLISGFLNPRSDPTEQIDRVRLYGPLFLFAYSLLNILLSTGDHALYYTPAEVGFLFPGPYRPRQLVLYKVASGLSGTLFTAGFLSFAFGQHTPRILSGFVGMFLAVQFLTLLSIAVNLTTNLVGAVAATRGRRALLAAVLVLLGGAALLAGRDLLNDSPAAVLDKVVRSPVLNALSLPFRPPVNAFLAREFWPELVLWSLAALAINGAFLAFILLLNTQFYETSAASSARIYDRLQAMRKGRSVSAPARNTRFRLPMAPWWGGAGPNIWRQCTTLVRTPGRLVGVFALMFVMPVLMSTLLPRKDSGPPVAIAGLTMMLSMALIAPTMIGFDFRTDLDRMESLKSLPIAPSRLAVGQVLTAALILTGAEWLTLGVLSALSPALGWWLLGLGALLLPFNALLVAIENLYFLFFPFRMNNVGVVDFQAMGRQILLFSAKFLTAGLAAGLSAALGAGAFFLLGRNWPAAFVLGWVGLSASALATVPLLAYAFERFDVAEVPSE